MPNHDRYSRSEPRGGSRYLAGNVGAESFCHVERRQPGQARHYVVHTASPRFVVELEEHASPARGGNLRQGVIRSVTVPNSWAGDYHHCARLLGAAVAFFESRTRSRAP